MWTGVNSLRTADGDESELGGGESASITRNEGAPTKLKNKMPPLQREYSDADRVVLEALRKHKADKALRVKMLGEPDGDETRRPHLRRALDQSMDSMNVKGKSTDRSRSDPPLGLGSS